MQPFCCEVLFLDPADVPLAKAALAAVDCELEIDPDATGDYPTVFGLVVGETELSEYAVGDWVHDIIGLLGGDIVEWRYGPPWKIGE